MNAKSLWKKRLHQFVRLRDKQTCWLCGRKVMLEEESLDHVWPKSRGGPTIRENLRLAHKICNLNRGNPMPNNEHIETVKALAAMTPQERDAARVPAVAQNGWAANY